jgi:outer membrane biosynthesis protein TonB
MDRALARRFIAAPSLLLVGQDLRGVLVCPSDVQHYISVPLRPNCMLTQRPHNHPIANRHTASCTVAVLLHLLLLLFLTPAREIFLDSSSARVQPDPLAFEFVESSAIPAEQPPDTRLVSDRNVRSADQSNADLPRSELAYNEAFVDIQGDFETRQSAESQDLSRRQEKVLEIESAETSEAEQIYKGLESMALLKRRGLMTRAQRERSVFGAPSRAKQSVAARNTESQALEQGGLQLSTYNWNFAPYLNYLKKRIQSHIFPPAAFTRLGLIDGESKVRFRIYPDGGMEGLEVLDSYGSELLLKTSTQAVELSAPFKPLPEDFPEPFLEITGIFAYLLLRNGS